jgi:hypothetical protein
LFTFLSPGFAAHSFFIITYYDVQLLLGIVLSVQTGWFHSMVILFSWLFDWFWYMVIPAFSVQFYSYCCCCCCSERMFAKLRKATITFIVSVWMVQFRSHWTDFHEIWKFVFTKTHKSNRYFAWRPMNIYILEWKLFQTKVVYTHFILNNAMTAVSPYLAVLNQLNYLQQNNTAL